MGFSTISNGEKPKTPDTLKLNSATALCSCHAEKKIYSSLFNASFTFTCESKGEKNRHKSDENNKENCRVPLRTEAF